MIKPTVLIVEDDAILVIHLEDLLKRQNYLVLQPVATGEEAITAVKKYKPSIVIMDIELSGEMNGIMAAEKIHAESDTPIVFLTGFSQDALLQQAKIAAPYGYLVKPVPERELAATLEMALYKHKIDHQIKESEARYRALVEQAEDGIFLADPEGYLIDVNTAGCNMLGFTQTECFTLNISELIIPEEKEQKISKIKSLQIGAGFQIEQTIIRKDGSRLPVEISGKKLENGCLQGIVRDITERKVAERQSKQNEERLESLLEITNHPSQNTQELLDFALHKAIRITQSKYGFIYYYDEVKQEFTLNSWSKEVMKTCEIVEPQTIYQLVKTGLWGEVVRQRKPIIDNEFQKNDPLKKGYPEGHVQLTKFLSIPVIINQTIVAVVGVANKISDYDNTDVLQLSLLMDSVWKILKQKEAEDSIRLQSTALNAAANAIIITDINGQIEWVNPAFCTMTGYSNEEVIGRTPGELVKSGLHDAAFYEKMWHTILKGNIWQGELINQRKDGVTFFEEMTITPLMNSEGVVTQFIAIKQDISKRKRTEAALEKRVLALTQPLENSTNINFEDLFNLSDIQQLQDEFARATGVASIITYPDGTPITRPSNFCRLCEDIIRKTKKGAFNCYQSDAALGKFDSEGPSIQPCKSGGLWDAGAGITVGGQHIANWLIGQVRDQTQTEAAMRAYADEIDVDQETFMEAFQEVPSMSSEQFSHIAQVLYTLANQLSTTAFQNVQQARFIADRNRVETALRHSEEQYRLLFEEMSEGFALHEIICDDQGLPVDYRFLEVNPMFEKMTGFKKDKIVGKTVLDVMPNTESYWIQTYGQVALTGKEIRYENYSEQLGKWFDVIAFSPKPGQFATTFNNITDRKIMENEIRESEEKYRTYVNQAPFGVFVTNEDGNYLQVNAAASKITGYSMPELLKMKIPDLFQEQTLEAAAIHFESVKNNGYASGEFPFLNKQQEVRWFSVTGVKLSENRFLGFVEDITGRKQADIKLEEQLDELTRWYTATLGRENRIIELKKEVNQLLKKHSLPVRYASIEENQYE